jgi:hypothetical protein
MTPQDVTRLAQEAGLYDDDQEPLLEHLARYAVNFLRCTQAPKPKHA